MSASLGMNYIAEGVESPADGAFVRKVGCIHAQGWAIARLLDYQTLRQGAEVQM